jgi:hypothetical protein
VVTPRRTCSVSLGVNDARDGAPADKADTIAIANTRRFIRTSLAAAFLAVRVKV